MNPAGLSSEPNRVRFDAVADRRRVRLRGRMRESMGAVKKHHSDRRMSSVRVQRTSVV